MLVATIFEHNLGVSKTQPFSVIQFHSYSFRPRLHVIQSSSNKLAKFTY